MAILVAFTDTNTNEDGYEIYVRGTEMTWDTDLPTPHVLPPNSNSAKLDYDETQEWYVIVAAVKGSSKMPAPQVHYEPGAGAGAYQNEIINDGPVLYWRMEETGGTVAADASGNGYDGAYQSNAVLAQPALFAGSGVSVKGLAAGKVVIAPVSVAPSNKISGTIAVKLPSKPAANSVLFSRQRDGYWPQVQFGVNQAGQPYFQLYYQNSDSGRANVIAPLDMCDGNTHILGYSWDRTGDKIPRIYIDGELAAYGPAWDYDLVVASLHEFTVNAPVINTFVDEAALFFSGIPATRFQAHYAASVGYAEENDPHLSDVVFLINASGVDGSTVITDFKGKTITVAGDAKISTSPGVPVVTFDGTGDYLEAAAHADFALGSIWTIEFLFIPGTNDGAYTRAILATNNWNTAGSGFCIGQYLGRLSVSNGSTLLLNSVGDLAQRTVNAVVVACDGTNTRIFLNGALLTTVAAATITSDKALRVADTPTGANRQNDCKVRAVRLTKGVCRRTTAYTPRLALYPEQ